MAARALAVVLTVVLLAPLNALASTAPPSGTGSDAFDADSALAYSQAAIGGVLGDHRLTDRRGRPVHLSELRGQPLMVSFVYTSCYHTCPTLTSHLADVVAVAREALGEDSFQVVTVGFDTANDTPARMRAFARERGIDIPGWRFLSTDAATIQALARDLGFVFFRSPKGFDHLAQTTVLDADGRVYRQVYGASFEAPALVEPLKELVFGRRANADTLDGWINNVRLFCTIYDPATGRYRFDYSIFIGAGIGLLSLGSVGAFLLRAWRQSSSPAAGARGILPAAQTRRRARNLIRVRRGVARRR